MRHSFYTFLFLFMFCIFAAPATAQVAGDSCVGTSTGATILGVAQALVCDGTNFKLMVETDSVGRSNLQIDDDTANPCDATKLGRLAYDDGVDTWQYCDGANWVDLVGASGGGGVVPFFFDFTDMTDQTTNTIVTSDIVLISGMASALQVTISGGGTPQFQICTDFDCSTVTTAWTNVATNINNGEYLQLRLTAAAAELTITTATVSVGDAVADWKVTTPEGLTVFVTSGSYTGAAVGGIAGADALCQGLADAVPLSGGYKAWLGIDATDNPANRFSQQNSGRPYVLTNGTVVADSWTDLIDGSLDSAIKIDENGTIRDFQDVWTGTNTNGNASFSDCSDWSSTSGSGTYGETEDTNNQWTNRGTRACGNILRLYCFEDSAGSSASAPPPSYVGDWTLAGTFDGVNSGTCADCDTGIDVPADAVDAVYILFARIWDSTEYNLSTYAYSFFTFYGPGGTSAGLQCTSVTAAPNTNTDCVVLSPPGVYGTNTGMIEILDDGNGKCEIERKVGDINIYYDNTDSTSSDCGGAVYYR